MAGIPETVRRHGIRPSKALGQNFLVDPGTIERIVRLAEVEPADRILEVGAGLGTLTKALARSAKEVIAIEFDRALLPILEEAVGHLSNVRVVHGDAMKLDYSKLLDSGEYRFVSNLPYNLATPLIARLLQEVAEIVDFVVMVQREVGMRLVSPPGSREYGGVSVMVRYFCEARILGRVRPTVFWPKPKVESVLLRLVRRPPPVGIPFSQLMRVVRAAFGQRRKMVRNSLAAGLALSPDTAERALAAAGVDPRVRAETLSIEDFARIAQALP